MTKIKNLETDTHVFFVGSPFSQWHPCKFRDEEGRAFNCAEQYMMFHKAILFGDRETAEKILAAESPKEQKALGRQVANFDVDVWNQYARDIVEKGNTLKFSQNPGLWYVLERTRGKKLVEAADYDPVWGIGLGAYDSRCLDEAQWQGRNWLGETLARVRDNLARQRLRVPPVLVLSAQEREYTYAFQALEIPGTQYVTTFKAMADHAGLSVDALMEKMKNFHVRDAEHITIDVPSNDNGRIITTNLHNFLNENSEIFAFAQIMQDAEMAQAFSDVLSNPGRAPF